MQARLQYAIGAKDHGHAFAHDIIGFKRQVKKTIFIGRLLALKFDRNRNRGGTTCLLEKI
ncbi:MAG TPA: hypothetical protein DEG06_11895 [Lachnospiraceae bacterium]|nr:hypothetical protein [Lachnospiraceae bacterium]HBY72933.1 hypothetical protein [Lachnospiraceae bacterium]HCR40352.1 hypothetical protein [Lachnospiraceae bacterium]